MDEGKFTVYCIVKSMVHPESALPRGVRGKPVGFIGENGLLAVVSSFETAGSRNAGAEVTAVLEHARVVEFFHCFTPTLPVRYGSCLGSEAGVREFLDRNRDAFSSRMVYLKDCVEFGITIHREPPTPASVAMPNPSPCPLPKTVSASSGAQYLKSRKSKYELEYFGSAMNRELFGSLERHLSGLFLEARKTRDLGGGLKNSGKVSYDFLVKWENRDGFKSACLDFRQDSASIARLSGPWPPYHFTD